MNYLKRYQISNALIIILVITLTLPNCKWYSFTGASIPANVKTFQVNFFENRAGNQPGSTVEPGLDRDFTNFLQDLLLNQTNLQLVNNNGHLIYEGDIVEYSVRPMTATSEITASQNRLTMTVAFSFKNTQKEEDNFNKNYSFFFDFPAERQVFEIMEEAHKDIFERICQNIFNDTLAKW